jgi:hypothetical protein
MSSIPLVDTQAVNSTLIKRDAFQLGDHGQTPVLSQTLGSLTVRDSFLTMVIFRPSAYHFMATIATKFASLIIPKR